MSTVMFEECAEINSCVTMTIDDSLEEGDELLDVILTNNTDIGNVTLRGGTLRIIQHDDGMCYLSVAISHWHYAITVMIV